jgi:lipopolysaccharide transport system permease protein
MVRWRGFIVGAAARELRERYARALLGWLWLVVPPAVFIAIYSLVFSRLARGVGLPDLGPYTYSVFLCAGLLTWLWFADLLGRLVGLFTRNAALLKKTQIPWSALLAVDLLVSLAGLAIQLSVFAALLVLLRLWPGWPVILFAPLLFVQLLLAVGLGLGLAVLHVFVRDVGLLVPLLLQIWFWLTPIIYTLGVLPERAGHWLRLNPVTPLIQAYQSVVLHTPAAIDWRGVGVLGLLSIVALTVSLRLLQRNLPFIYDEI